VKAFQRAVIGGLPLYLKFGGRCEDHPTNDRQALGTAMVQRVLRSMVIAPERGQVDDIDCRRAPAQERRMVVFDWECAAAERSCVS